MQQFTLRARLRNILVDRFSLGELKDVAFDLGVDYQLFTHVTKREFSRELIAHFERRDQLSCLVTAVLMQRHDDVLVQLLAKLPACSPRKRIQIIVDEDLLGDVSELLEDLATKLKVAKDEVVLIGAAWESSMRLLVGLPERVANLRALSKIHSLVDRKYQINSIVLFNSLDQTRQRAWRLVACDWPLVCQGNVLRPAVSWKDALEATRGAPTTSYSTPPERLPEQVRHISQVFDIAPSPQAIRLRRILSTRLSLEDFRNLCFDLGVNYDHLGGEGLTGKARELVRHLQRRDALAELIEWLRRERSDVEVR
jgi:hypothetical protein